MQTHICSPPSCIWELDPKTLWLQQTILVHQTPRFIQLCGCLYWHESVQLVLINCSFSKLNLQREVTWMIQRRTYLISTLHLTLGLATPLSATSILHSPPNIGGIATVWVYLTPMLQNSVLINSILITCKYGSHADCWALSQDQLKEFLQTRLSSLLFSHSSHLEILKLAMIQCCLQSPQNVACRQQKHRAQNMKLY